MSTDALIDGAARASWARGSRCVDFDCDHMVPQAKPAETAAVDPRPARTALAMAAVTDEQVETVRALVASIPPGRVATYGDIASAAGLSSPRIVGWIMRTDSSDLPWHRVITASGPAGRAPGHPPTGAAARRGRAGRRRPESHDLTPRASRSRVLTESADASDYASAQPHQRGGAGQTGERRGGRPRMQRVHGEPEHQRAQQHLRPLRQRRPPLDRARRRPRPTTARRRPRPRPPTTRAASTGVMSVMPGAAVPAKSTVP